MGTSKYTAISLLIVWTAAAAAGQDQLAPRSANSPGGDAEAVNLMGQGDELTRRLQDLELDEAGIDAGRKALQEQMAAIRDEVDKRSGDDPVTQQLRKLLAAGEENLAQLQRSAAAGRASSADVTRARESVVKARIDLARRQEEMARAGGGGQLQEFTKEQSRLAIDQAGKEAQLQVVRRQLEEVQKRLAQVAPSAQHTDADAVNLGGQRSELMRKAQGLELDLAGLDAGRKALQEQIAAIRDEAGKRLGDDPVTRELQRLVALGEDRLARVQQSAAAGRASAGDVAEAQKNLAQVRIDLARRQEELRRQTSGGQLEEFVRELRHGAVERAQKAAQLGTVRRQLEQVQKRLAQVALVAPRTDADAVNLGGQRNDLTRRAQVLELDLAGIDARRKALQEQVVMIRDEAGKQLDTDVVTQELQQLLAVCEESLVQVRKAVEAERLLLADVARAQENVARARIDLARRREELTRAAGGGLLEEFTRELSRLAIDKAQKEAQRQTVGRQLDEVQRQLVQTLVSDP